MVSSQLKDIQNVNLHIPSEELNWSSVSVSEILDNQFRLEASLFNLEGKHAREVVENSRWEKVPIVGEGGLATAFHRARFKRVWVNKSELPIYQPATINEINPKPSGYISEKTNTDIDALRVKKGQILLTCSGTIGNTTVVSETLDNRIFSHDLIRVNAKDPIDIGYIYTFFKTKVGFTLINTNNYGAVISHIEPHHLANVPIPNAPNMIKKKINDSIIESFNLRDLSNKKLEEATELLKTALSLPEINDIEVQYYDNSVQLKNFSVSLSDLNNRFEGSYHIPLVNQITEILKENSEEVVNLGDKSLSDSILLPGRFKRVYVEEGQGTVFFGGKQLLELEPSTKKYLSTKIHSDRLLNELILKENTILITRSGTIGKVVLVPKHWENWVANEHIIRVFPSSDEIAGYLYVFLSSDFGYELITRNTYGSVVDEIDANHLRSIPVPLLKNKEIQQIINDLALESNQLRYEAYLLEQKAIKIFEEEVLHQ